MNCEKIFPGTNFGVKFKTARRTLHNQSSLEANLLEETPLRSNDNRPTLSDLPGVICDFKKESDIISGDDFSRKQANKLKSRLELEGLVHPDDLVQHQRMAKGRTSKKQSKENKENNPLWQLKLKHRMLYSHDSVSTPAQLLNHSNNKKPCFGHASKSGNYLTPVNPEYWMCGPSMYPKMISAGLPHRNNNVGQVDSVAAFTPGTNCENGKERAKYRDILNQLFNNRHNNVSEITTPEIPSTIPFETLLQRVPKESFDNGIPNYWPRPKCSKYDDLSVEGRLVGDNEGQHLDHSQFADSQEKPNFALDVRDTRNDEYCFYSKNSKLEKNYMSLNEFGNQRSFSTANQPNQKIIFTECNELQEQQPQWNFSTESDENEFAFNPTLTNPIPERVFFGKLSHVLIRETKDCTSTDSSDQCIPSSPELFTSQRDVSVDVNNNQSCLYENFNINSTPGQSHLLDPESNADGTKTDDVNDTFNNKSNVPVVNLHHKTGSFKLGSKLLHVSSTEGEIILNPDQWKIADELCDIMGKQKEENLQPQNLLRLS